ncbi:MAG: competence type IV pilus assembly protein ComGB [Solibacillus sp.]|jgi:competence protein ComGB|uniref:competence type IV pilus assembly protein ComGB n=1 Tax=unclassified Solibacillus TaxID=2637870 RepID=UPI0030F6FCDA
MNITLIKERLNFALSQKKTQKSVADLATFLDRMSTLLSEGYTFAHCIEMLLPYHAKHYERVQQEITSILNSGGNATQVLQILGLEKQYLVSIELAELTGQLQETVLIVSKQLIFQRESKSKLLKVLTYPIILFLFITFLFFAFRTYFLPNMSSMVTTRATSEVSSSIQWSTFFLHLPDYIVGVTLITCFLLFLYFVYIRKKRIDLQLKLLFRLPFIGLFWRLVLTRQFSRVLGNLLMAGFSMQQAFEHLNNQQHQKQIAYVSEVLQKRVIWGESLASAVKQVGYFYPKFEHFIAHGEASGLLGRELILYCELLDERLQAIIRLLLGVIQPLLFIIIAICVIAAYLSILIPMYDVLDFI